MRAIEIASPGAPLELVERPLPQPGPGQVRIRVQACGVCHSDEIARISWIPPWLARLSASSPLR